SRGVIVDHSGMSSCFRITAGLLIGLAGHCATAAADTSTAVFSSGGVPIQVDVFTPSGGGIHPSIVYAYGSDGMSLFPYGYKANGTWFASQGFNFFLVHYFD